MATFDPEVVDALERLAGDMLRNRFQQEKNMACECSNLDWTGCDMSAEHHPECGRDRYQTVPYLPVPESRCGAGEVTGYQPCYLLKGHPGAHHMKPEGGLPGVLVTGASLNFPELPEGATHWNVYGAERSRAAVNIMPSFPERETELTKPTDLRQFLRSTLVPGDWYTVSYQQLRAEGWQQECFTCPAEEPFILDPGRYRQVMVVRGQVPAPQPHPNMLLGCGAHIDGVFTKCSLKPWHEGPHQFVKDDPLRTSMDAKVWAQEFIKTIKEHPEIPYDEGTMIAWFANSIMRGYDEGFSRGKKTAVEQIRTTLSEL